jgi:imidazolonepropionase-like amidohydrolase
MRAYGWRRGPVSSSPPAPTSGGGSLRANQLAWEIECLVTAGLQPWQALAAATRNGGTLLGEADAGIIRARGPADFVLVHGDPLSDPASMWRVWLVP